MAYESIYVFLSHSHYDYDKVSRLRNLLEAEGFRPLMFFLKAFEKEEYKPMLKPIIKEEIDQRHRFILCRSQNSQKSEWVKFEEDYIKSKRRPYEVIDLDASEEIQLKRIRKYRKRSVVYISHSSSQNPLVSGLLRRLEEEGFNPLDGLSLPDFDLNLVNPQQGLNMDIEKAAEEGFVLWLIGDCIGAVQSELLLRVLNNPEKREFVIPVVVAGAFSVTQEGYISRLNLLDLRNLPIEDQICKITQELINQNLSLNED